MSLKEKIDIIIDDIKTYSPHPEKVKLVAVTKYSTVSDIKKLFEIGYYTIGENKAQVMRDKIEYFNNIDIKNIEWHFIGNLQTNKIKYIINNVSLIHSVNRLSLAEELDKKAKEINKKINVLIEINIYGEESKHGYILEELYKDIPKLINLENINIIGLMTMAPFVEDNDLIRFVFSKLRKIKNELNKNFFNGKLTELSMGMSNDYKIALEEGSTIIRIGSNIFL